MHFKAVFFKVIFNRNAYYHTPTSFHLRFQFCHFRAGEITIETEEKI